MTEMQNTSPDHRRPLAPGEIRTQWVGNQLFTVMHVAGGMYTQASVRESGQPTRVLATERFERDAVAVYAYAIECAEADALDDADDVQCVSPATGELVVPGITDVPQDRSADGVPEVEQQRQPLKVDRAIAELRYFEEIDRAAVARGESANWWERTGDVDPMYNTPMGASTALVTGERPQQRFERATDAHSTAYRMHMPCRRVMIESRSACRYCDEVGEWRALYTLGGA